MASKIINNSFFYLFVFTLLFGVLFYNMIGFKAMDEISGLILLVIYLIYLFTTNDRKFNAGVLITLAIFIFYFCYSIYVSYNIHQAIILDFLIQIRPYLTFFIVSQISPSFSKSQKLLLKRLCVIMWVLMIPVGMYGFVSPSFFYAIFEQPSNYVVNIGCLSFVYLFCSNFSIRDRILFFIMFATGLLATYTHFYSILLLTCGILLYFHHPNVFKFNLRTGIALAIITLIVIHIARIQVSEYVTPVNTTSQTSRSYLYKTSVDILKDFFPLGSGFASFGTDASGLYYSKIYSKYGLTSIDGLSQQDWFSVSDSYYPSLAQFGIVGIILYLFFWGLILSKALAKFKEEGDIQLFVLVLILASFVFIENISDSFFTSNKGYYMMMFLGVLFGKKKTLNQTMDNYDNTFVASAPAEYAIENETIKNNIQPINGKVSDVQISSIENKSYDEENKLEQDRVIYRMPPIPIREEDLLEKEMQAYTSQLLEKDHAEHKYQEQEDPNENFYEDEDDFDDDEYDDNDFDDEEDTFDSEQNTKQENTKDITSASDDSSENKPDNHPEITDEDNLNPNGIISETEIASTPKIENSEDQTAQITDISISQKDDDFESAPLIEKDKHQQRVSLVDDNKDPEELQPPVQPKKKKVVKTTGKTKLAVNNTDQDLSIKELTGQPSENIIEQAPEAKDLTIASDKQENIAAEKATHHLVAETFAMDTNTNVEPDNSTKSPTIINNVTDTDGMTVSRSKEINEDMVVRQNEKLQVTPVENTEIENNSSIPETIVDNPMINISASDWDKIVNNNFDEILLPVSETDITPNSDLVKEYMDIIEEHITPQKEIETQEINETSDYIKYLEDYLTQKKQENTIHNLKDENNEQDEQIDYII